MRVHKVIISTKFVTSCKLFLLIHRYVPPIHASTSPNLPETVEDIQLELRKQESLLNQIHSEMNAGFVTKKREEELWETQRIITQLKVCDIKIESSKKIISFLLILLAVHSASCEHLRRNKIRCKKAWIQMP
jgi:hypothetical protein